MSTNPIVEVVSIVDDGYYKDANTSGNCVKVVLRRGYEFVSCGQILIFEEEDDEIMDDIFDEWVKCAVEGEEGYSYWWE